MNSLKNNTQRYISSFKEVFVGIQTFHSNKNKVISFIKDGELLAHFQFLSNSISEIYRVKSSIFKFDELKRKFFEHKKDFCNISANYFFRTTKTSSSSDSLSATGSETIYSINDPTLSRRLSKLGNAMQAFNQRDEVNFLYTYEKQNSEKDPIHFLFVRDGNHILAFQLGIKYETIIAKGASKKVYPAKVYQLNQTGDLQVLKHENDQNSKWVLKIAEEPEVEKNKDFYEDDDYTPEPRLSEVEVYQKLREHQIDCSFVSVVHQYKFAVGLGKSEKNAIFELAKRAESDVDSLLKKKPERILKKRNQFFLFILKSIQTFESINYTWRDLKLPNILMDGDDFLLTDFGYADGTQDYMTIRDSMIADMKPLHSMAIGVCFIKVLEKELNCSLWKRSNMYLDIESTQKAIQSLLDDPENIMDPKTREILAMTHRMIDFHFENRPDIQEVIDLIEKKE